tara:strand:- start:3917 stop:4978 length:1062 start_codon:yes stop_codon:yes gene_type:complete
MDKLKKFYKNKKVLVTGATGFKGAWLCFWLKKLGAKITGIGYNPNKNKNLFYQLELQKKINLHLIDIRNFNKIKKIVKKEKPSVIFHLAAQPLIYESYKKPMETFDINYRGSLNIIELARTEKFIRSTIIVTSDKCYESNFSSKGFKETDLLGGVDPYSASKSSTEIMARAYRESFFKDKNSGISTGRAGNVIGGGDWSPNRLIPDCIRSLKTGKSILIRNPKFNRPWQLVLEPLKGYLILAQKQFNEPKKFSGAWNFGTRPNSLTDVQTIVKYLIMFWGQGKMKVKKNKIYEQENLQLNIKKAEKFLKWKPTYNIKRSVEMTTSWYFRVLMLKEDPKKVTSDQIESYMYDSK